MEFENHLMWARIKVKGPSKNISVTIEVEDGDWRYTLPVWCEAPTRVERARVDNHQ